MCLWVVLCCVVLCCGVGWGVAVSQGGVLGLTAAEIADDIAKKGYFTVTCGADDVATILEALCYDGSVERTKAAPSTFDEFQMGKRKRVKKKKKKYVCASFGTESGTIGSVVFGRVVLRYCVVCPPPPLRAPRCSPCCIVCARLVVLFVFLLLCWLGAAPSMERLTLLCVEGSILT